MTFPPNTARHRLAVLLAALVLTFGTGCQATSTTATTPTPQSNGPTLLDDAWTVSSAGRFSIRYPGSSHDAKPVSIDIRVLVDSTGHAQMPTLRISGPGASENRDAITQHIRTSTFKPTAKNPDRLPGYYHSRIELLPP